MRCCFQSPYESKMADIFREVDEEVRRERILKLWANNRHVIIALAIILVAGTGAWRFYTYQRDSAAQAAGARYEAAAQLAREGKSGEAAAAFEELSRTAPKGYASLARLRAANERAASDSQAAVQEYESLAADASADAGLRDLAKLRAAMLRVDSDDPLEFEKKFAPLASDSFAYHHQIRELLGLAALRRSSFDSAERWFDGIASDPRAPAGVRMRAEALMSIAQASMSPQNGKQAAQGPDGEASAK